MAIGKTATKKIQSAQAKVVGRITAKKKGGEKKRR